MWTADGPKAFDPLTVRRDEQGHGLQVEDEAFGFRAGAAGEELVVGGAFFGVEEVVAVVWFAFDDAGEAGAADALLAGDGDVDADARQCVDDGFIFAH